MRSGVIGLCALSMLAALAGCAGVPFQEKSHVICGVNRVDSVKNGLRIYFERSWKSKFVVMRGIDEKRTRTYELKDGLVSWSGGATTPFVVLNFEDRADVPFDPWSSCSYKAETDGKQPYLQVAYFHGDADPEGETCRVIPSRESATECKAIPLD
jgi:hypothetical protein